MTQASGELRTAEAEKDALATDEEQKTPLAPWQQWPQRLSAMAHFSSVRDGILCLLIGGIALSFNCYRLGAQSMWFDEILSVERARQSLPTLLQIIFATQPNMAAYYVLMHFWLGFTTWLGWNPTEVVVRSPSAVFAAASTVMVFLLGRRFLSMVAGLVAASLYLLNDLQLVYAQDTRSYALLLLLICVAWYALFMTMTAYARQKRWWLCFGIAMVLAIYSQLFSFLILAAQMTTFVGLALLPGLWRTKVRQQFRHAVVTLVSIFVLVLPIIYASRHGAKTGWLPIPQPMDVYLLFLTICANSRIYLSLLLALIVLGLSVTILAYRAWGRSLLRRVSLVQHVDEQHIGNIGSVESVGKLQGWLPVGFALVCWVIVPLVLSYLISQGSTRLFSSRYLVTIVPPFMLLVGLGIAVLGVGLVPVPRGSRSPRLPHRPRVPLAGTLVLQIALVVGVLLLTLHYVPLYYQHPQAEDWNVTTFWLEQHYQANDGLVCFDNSQGCQLGIEYYLTAYPSAAHFTADSPGSFPWVQYDLTDHQGNTTLAVDPKALANFGAHHPRVFFITGRLASRATIAQAHTAQQWLDAHYHFVAQIVTKSVAIRLYATD